MLPQTAGNAVHTLSAAESAYPNGVPAAIPGTIDFDNYDTGGQGVAYNTTNTTNRGGKYRNDGVGIETSSDTGNGNGYDVGWNAVGNWYKYTVNVQTAAVYTVSFRIAATAAGALHVENESGANLTGSIAVASTGGYQTWKTLTARAALTAGPHVLKVVIDSGNGTFNLNDMTFAGAAYPNGVPAAIPGTIDFDNYDMGGQGVAYNTTSSTNQGGKYRNDGVGIETSSDTGNGNGYDVGWNAVGNWYNYSVNVATMGTYSLAFRIAANAAGTFHMQDELGNNLTGEVPVSSTGGYQVWQTFSASAALTAGPHIFRMVIDSGNGTFNLNDVSMSTQTASPSPGATPNFGPNVVIFSPSMSATSIQSTITNIYNQQQSNQFGTNRYALMFLPGTYTNVNVNVGYYTQVLGLGQTPNAVTINGSLQSTAAWNGGNGTENFWRAAENFAVNPQNAATLWVVSQASPLRRMHIEGPLALSLNGGYTSGGFLADSLIDGQVNSGTQQQWISRNDQWSSWTGSAWNMVFVGDVNAPSTSFPNPPNTTTSQTPLVREKPYLYVDSSGNYNVFVPALRTGSQGTSWSGTAAGQSLPISRFYIAQAAADTASTINAALAKGLNLILTPGIYNLSSPIQVNNPNTVVLGLGLATLVATSGNAAVTVADVDGVSIGGVIIQAGGTNSPVLMQVGPPGSSATHANPTVLYDIYARIGGAAAGSATVSLQINSNNVIGDDLWLWRADHGTGVGWTSNTAANGLVVNGTNVTMYGLAVEHYQQYQTLWNANGGLVYFYQSEAPYDPPNQAAWMDPSGNNGYASYKVADSVTSHQGWGVGVYCYFNVNSSVQLRNAIEVPTTGLNGAMMHDMTTVSLGGVGTIDSILDGYGAAANSSQNLQTLTF